MRSHEWSGHPAERRLCTALETEIRKTNRLRLDNDVNGGCEWLNPDTDRIARQRNRGVGRRHEVERTVRILIPHSSSHGRRPLRPDSSATNGKTVKPAHKGQSQTSKKQRDRDGHMQCPHVIPTTHTWDRSDSRQHSRSINTTEI